MHFNFTVIMHNGVDILHIYFISRMGINFHVDLFLICASILLLSSQNMLYNAKKTLRYNLVYYHFTFAQFVTFNEMYFLFFTFFYRLMRRGREGLETFETNFIRFLIILLILHIYDLYLFLNR